VCTLAAAFFPQRRIREPARPIAFPHLPTDLLDDLLRGTWKSLYLEPRKRISCFIHVCGLSAALDQQAVRQDEGTVGSSLHVSVPMNNDSTTDKLSRSLRSKAMHWNAGVHDQTSFGITSRCRCSFRSSMNSRQSAAVTRRKQNAPAAIRNAFSTTAVSVMNPLSTAPTWAS
jgi:hypothetical protein